MVDHTEETTGPTIDRRTALKTGGIGAVMLGIAGYSSSAAAETIDNSATPESSAIGDGEEGSLGSLLERNRGWSAVLPDEYFEGVRNSQSPPVVSVCCSDSRVAQSGMFLAPLEPGNLFKPSNIGNKVTRTVDGEQVVDGNFLYGLANADAPTGAVVGHTGCGAVTAAYQAAIGEGSEQPPGIEAEVAPIIDIVEEALEGNAIDTDAEDGRIINQLVEYNVNAQIEFLRAAETISDEKDLYGFVYDFQQAYSDVDGRTVLVNANGDTDPEALRGRVPDGYEEFVDSLLA
jgi:carbonic anhydrase